MSLEAHLSPIEMILHKDEVGISAASVFTTVVGSNPSPTFELKDKIKQWPCNTRLPKMFKLSLVFVSRLRYVN